MQAAMDVLKGDAAQKWNPLEGPVREGQQMLSPSGVQAWIGVRNVKVAKIKTEVLVSAPTTAQINK